MVKGKKITKKQLKEPDEFITLTERGVIFVQQHSKKIAVAGVLLLVLILSVVFWGMWEKKKEEQAALDYRVALELYEQSRAPGRVASEQEDKAVLAKFDELITQYPRTSSGRFALLYKGNILLSENKYDEAAKEYSAFLDKAGKEKLFRYFAWEGIGRAYEGKKDYAKAIEAYQKVLELGEGYAVADAHLSLGNCYEKLGKNKEAIEQFNAFLGSGQKSSLTNIVLRKVSLLEKQ